MKRKRLTEVDGCLERVRPEVWCRCHEEVAGCVIVVSTCHGRGNSRGCDHKGEKRLCEEHNGACRVWDRRGKGISLSDGARGWSEPLLYDAATSRTA